MKTITIKETILIDSNKQEVWDFTQNFDKRKSWDASILELKILQKKPYKLVWFKAVGGLTAKLQYKLCNKPLKTTLKLTDINSKIINGGGGSWNYETVNNKTRWTQVNSLTFKNKFLHYVLGRITEKSLRKITKKSMNKAKVLIEKSKCLELRP